MRLPAILLSLCLIGCSLTKKGPEKPAATTNAQAPAPAAQDAPPIKEPKQPVRPAHSEQTLPTPPVMEDPAWPSTEDPGRAWDEADPTPEVEEERKGLFDTLTANYGVRLPHSNSRGSLLAAIGDGDWTVEFDRGRPAGARVFAREIIVGISKNDIFVNDFLVVSVTCSTSEGGPCPESFDSDRNDLIYQVPPEMRGKSAQDAYVITPLLKQLQDLQRIRREVLHGMDEGAAAWLMDCDSFTLAVDRAIPFDLLAKVIHTAGYADLTRVRLATLDDDNNLTYIPILAPRLDHGQRKVEHLIGDGWWQRQQRQPDEAFAYAYINYSASPFPETFAAAATTELPSCLPLGVAWEKIIEDPEFARITREKVLAHIAEARASHAQLLGLEASPAPPEGLRVQPTLDSLDRVPPLPGNKGEEKLDANSVDGFPASRVLLPEVAGSHAGAPPEAGSAGVEEVDGPARTEAFAVRPFAFVGPDGIVLTLRTPAGKLFQAVSVPNSDPDRLYQFLKATFGWALGVSADLSLPTEGLVGALDTLRFRCLVYTMSGKCKRWEQVLPHLYFFLPPGNRFAPLPTPDGSSAAPEAVPVKAPGTVDVLPGKASEPASPAEPAGGGEHLPADSPLLP